MSIDQEKNGLKKSYVVGVERQTYAPFFSFETQEFAASKILQLFARQQGIELIFKTMNVVELYYHFFIARDIDLKFPDDPAWRPDLREKATVRYSRPVLEYCDGLLLAPKSAGKSFGQLRLIGIVQGFTPQAIQSFVDDRSILLLSTPDSSKLLSAAIHNRVDAIYMNIDVAMYLLKNEFSDNMPLHYTNEMPKSCGGYRLSTIGHPDLIQHFDEFMVSQQDDILAIKKTFHLQFSSEPSVVNIQN